MIDQKREAKSLQKTKNDSANKSNNVSKHQYQEQKWCYIHRTRSHNTLECITNKENQGHRKNDDKKNYAIKENNVTTKTLELHIELLDKNIKALINTGSSHNYFSKELVTRLGIPCKNLDVESQAKMANGNVEPIK